MSVVVITDTDLGTGDLERAVLRGHEVRVLQASDRDGLIAQAADADALLVQWRTIDRYVLERLPRVRAIVRYGIGLDNIDQDFARGRGITVANVPDYCVDEVAAHAAAMIMTRARRLVDLDRGVKAGSWSIEDVDPPQHPSDDPVGIVGLGRIGSRLAELMRGLGHPVLAWDPFVDRWPAGVDRVGTTEQLAAEVNHLSLHVPLTAETAGIAGPRLLAALGPLGHLVNTSRGGLVDEPALLEALDGGLLGAASLDVLAEEPPTDRTASLRAHRRVLITPHAAYYSQRSRVRLQQRAAEILAQLIE